ncbi:MAG: S-layer family protein, partial [Gammaproteobacteria bacterium]|nr:S-layer family protein [Gammaproteobacteria bacterium]
QSTNAVTSLTATTTDVTPPGTSDLAYTDTNGVTLTGFTGVFNSINIQAGGLITDNTNISSGDVTLQSSLAVGTGVDINNVINATGNTLITANGSNIAVDNDIVGSGTTTINANGGDVSIANTAPVSGSTVQVTGGTVSIADSVSATGAATITGTGASGNVITVTNQGSVSSSGGTTTLQSTGGGDISLAGNISATGGNDVTLSVSGAGNIVQATGVGNGFISGNLLTVNLGSGDASLNQSTNAVTSLTATTTDVTSPGTSDLAYTDTNGVTLTGFTGVFNTINIQAGGLINDNTSIFSGDVTLQSSLAVGTGVDINNVITATGNTLITANGSDITIDNDIVGTGTTTINANGGAVSIANTAPVSGSTVQVTGGTVSIADSVSATGAATITGTGASGNVITVTNQGSVSSAGGTTTLQATGGGDISLAGNISATGGNDVTLSVSGAGNIVQATGVGNGFISGNLLTVTLGSGDASLNQSTNAVTSLTATTTDVTPPGTSDLAYTDTNGVTLTGFTGVFNSINVQAGGLITDNTNIFSGDVTLQSSLAVGTGVDINNVITATGNTLITANGSAITVDNDIVGTGTTTINANGGAVSIANTAPVSGSTVQVTGGTVSIADAVSATGAATITGTGASGNVITVTNQGSVSSSGGTTTLQATGGGDISLAGNISATGGNNVTLSVSGAGNIAQATGVGNGFISGNLLTVNLGSGDASLNQSTNAVTSLTATTTDVTSPGTSDLAYTDTNGVTLTGFTGVFSSINIQAGGLINDNTSIFSGDVTLQSSLAVG